MRVAGHRNRTVRAAAKPRRAATGFTLIELLVVVLLLVMAVAMVPMTSGADDESKLAVVEMQVRDAVERARMLATSTRTPHGVLFDLGLERFAIVDGTGTAATDPLTRRDYVIRYDVPGQPKYIDFTAASFGATGLAAVFDSQGVPEAGGTVTFASGTVSRTLQLDAAVGTLSIP